MAAQPIAWLRPQGAFDAVAASHTIGKREDGCPHCPRRRVSQLDLRGGRVWPGLRRASLPRQSPAREPGQRRRRRRLDLYMAQFGTQRLSSRASQNANCTNGPFEQRAHQEPTPKSRPGLGLHMGAGDGNRTRTISLGIRQIGAADRPDLDIRCTASGRDGPCETRVNGPPMARVSGRPRRGRGTGGGRLRCAAAGGPGVMHSDLPGLSDRSSGCPLLIAAGGL